MALTLGVAALFFGVVFIIVGWKGGGIDAMNTNLVGMMEGQYPVGGKVASTATPATKTPATSTSGGAHAPAKK